MKPRSTERTLPIPIGPVLYLAIELSQKNWKLGFTIGFGQSARLRNISARDIKSLQKEIQMAKKRFHLPETIAVISCYEAGRDGFWIHRCLTSLGIMNLVVDSSSIEVNRRARRNKTDKLDVEKLLNMLMRYHHGEDKVWSVVNIPGEDIEDYRQLHRERSALQKERTRLINRIKGLLATQGLILSVTPSFPDQLAKLRLCRRRHASLRGRTPPWVLLASLAGHAGLGFRAPPAGAPPFAAVVLRTTRRLFLHASKGSTRGSADNDAQASLCVVCPANEQRPDRPATVRSLFIQRVYTSGQASSTGSV